MLNYGSTQKSHLSLKNRLYSTYSTSNMLLKISSMTRHHNYSSRFWYTQHVSVSFLSSRDSSEFCPPICLFPTCPVREDRKQYPVRPFPGTDWPVHQWSNGLGSVPASLRFGGGQSSAGDCEPCYMCIQSVCNDNLQIRQACNFWANRTDRKSPLPYTKWLYSKYSLQAHLL